MRRLKSDTRGLGMGIIGFFAILIVAALLFTLFNPAASEVFSMVSSQTNNAEAQAAIDRREQIWSLMLYFCVFLAGLFLLARAVFESRGPGV